MRILAVSSARRRMRCLLFYDCWDLVARERSFGMLLVTLTILAASGDM